MAAARRKTAQGRETEDAGAEVAAHAGRSGKASLLTCIDPEGQGHEGAAGRLAGGEKHSRL